MNFKEYQKRAYVAIQAHESEKDEVLNWAVGLAEEVGEILNIIKHKFWGGEEADPVEVAKELGDVLWYASALAKTLGLDLGAVAELNIAKLEHRFSEEVFTKKDSESRKEKEYNFKETEVYKKIIKELFL